MAVPKYTQVQFGDSRVERKLDQFFSVYCINSPLLQEFSKTPINISGEDMQAWFDRKIRNIDIDRDYQVNDCDPSRFNLSLKPQTKSTIYEPFKEVKGQTIHEHGKSITMEFGSIMKQVFERLRSVLKEHCALDLTMDEQERVDWFARVKGSKSIEIHMIAFDKSQGSFHLDAFCRFLVRMGVCQDVADWWYKVTKRTQSKTRDKHISFWKWFQLNSGCMSTIFQNTFSAMLILMELLKNKWAILKSDDSMIFDVDVSTQQLEDMSAVYNMEAKLLSSKQLGYYCGSFVYLYDGKWCVCKDYVKRVEHYR